MFLRLLRPLFLTLSLLPVVHAAPPVIEVTMTSPESPIKLSANEPFYVRIKYQSDQSLRFQALGYARGQRVPKLFHNPSAVYPSGTGEAIAWIAAEKGAQVDELRVVASDQKGQPLVEIPVPVLATWHAEIPPHHPAPWVASLSNAQQQAVKAEFESQRPWNRTVKLLTPVAFLSLPAYPILQILAFAWLREGRRRFALLPLVIMVPAYGYCLFAWYRGSATWALPALWTSPLAALFVLLSLLAARRHMKKLPPATTR